MNNSTPANVICPPCENQGGLLESCVTQGDFGVPVCQDGLACRTYMGKENICVPSGIGTEGKQCVPGYGDLMTCYDDSLSCVNGLCTKKGGHRGNKKINGWVIGAIICIIIILILLLVVGLKK
jgi:hypothetical protein